MLRVVSGKYKSRRIKEVNSSKTRPTTDRNKEALFNTIGQFFSGETVLDLFSGSGSLGIEAISRGAGFTTFIDFNYLSINIIKDNLRVLGIADNFEVQKTDAIRYLMVTYKKFDIIICDPPYALLKYDEILRTIATRQLLNKGGIIIFEAGKETALPESFINIYKYKEKHFGNTMFGFYTTEVE